MEGSSQKENTHGHRQEGGDSGREGAIQGLNGNVKNTIKIKNIKSLKKYEDLD